jgi:hypothetical protein
MTVEDRLTDVDDKHTQLVTRQSELDETVNFPFIFSSTWIWNTCFVSLSRFIRYSRACGSHDDFRDSG